MTAYKLANKRAFRREQPANGGGGGIMAANAAERIGEAFALFLASSFKKQSICMAVEVYFTRIGGYFTIICSCGARGVQGK